MEQTKKDCQEVRRIRLADSVVQDLRSGLRQLRTSPGFTAAAVFTLALGIGAKSSVVIVVGITVGVFAALGLTRLMSSFLVGVGAQDPVTYIGVSVLLLLVALLACCLPARRAMRIDPTSAIRYE